MCGLPRTAARLGCSFIQEEMGWTDGGLGACGWGGRRKETRGRGGIRAAHGRTHGADGGARARRSTRQGPPPPGRVPECAFSCGAGPSGGDARIVTAARCGTATCARVAFRDADGIIFLFIYLFIIYFGRRGGWNGLDWISASRSHWQVVAGELGNRSIDG